MAEDAKKTETVTAGGVAGTPQNFQVFQAGAAAPPTMNASHMVIGLSPVEVSVMLGHTRMAPTQAAGAISAVQLVEWFTTLTLSPTAAQQLRDGLNVALETYAKQFGAIPKVVVPPKPPPQK